MASKFKASQMLYHFTQMQSSIRAVTDIAADVGQLHFYYDIYTVLFH